MELQTVDFCFGDVISDENGRAHVVVDPQAWTDHITLPDGWPMPALWTVALRDGKLCGWNQESMQSLKLGAS